MKELGFLMDREGNMYYFGEWIEYGTPNKKRPHWHNTSFEDEVLCLDEIKKLKLNYDKDTYLIVQSMDYTKHGIITFCNMTRKLEDGLEFVMSVPYKLSRQQEKRLIELYPVLSRFSEQCILDLDHDYDKYSSIDDYLEKMNIREMQTTSKRM